MFQIWKETLLPGSQLDPKTRRPFTITPRDKADVEALMDADAYEKHVESEG